MAVQLFRQGRTHEVRGIKCEMQTFSEFNFINMLDVGWFLSPEEAYGKDKEVKFRELAREAGIVNWENRTDGLDEEQIRLMAKEAKISNWHNRKIETLREMLNDNQS